MSPISSTRPSVTWRTALAIVNPDGKTLRRVSCKHCNKTIKFTIPKHGTVHDVQIHAEHDCVAHAFETPPVDNVGTYFSAFGVKDGKSTDSNVNSRPRGLKWLGGFFKRKNG